MTGSKFDPLLGRVRESDIQNIAPPGGGSTPAQSDTGSASIQLGTSVPIGGSEGDLFYDTDDNILYVYSSGSWHSVGSGGGGASGDSLQNQEYAASYVYVGYENTDGSWFIYRRTYATNARQYATGSSDYATNWTGRAGLTYA